LAKRYIAETNASLLNRMLSLESVQRLLKKAAQFAAGTL
jgi:hypothetical protein